MGPARRALSRGLRNYVPKNVTLQQDQLNEVWFYPKLMASRVHVNSHRCGALKTLTTEK